MGWTIREAEAGDAASLALAGAATFLDAFAGVLDGRDIVAHCGRVHTADALTEALREGRAWLAEIGGAPIGYALAGTPSLAGARAGDLELKRIYVLSRFGRAGIGMALLGRAIEAARSAGCGRLVLGVYGGNGRALAFYARAGFRQIGTRRFLVGHREHDDVVLGLDLA